MNPFWGNYPDASGAANHWRQPGRLFIGKSWECPGRYAPGESQGPWMGLTSEGAAWSFGTSQVHVGSAIGGIAVTGMSRTSDAAEPLPNCASIGIAGFIKNDRLNAGGWALYADVQHEDGAGWSAGIEIAVKNKGANGNSTPYTVQGGPNGIWLAGGGDDAYGGAPTNPSNTAIYVLKNKHTWNKGIVFGATALTGSDGVDGTATAIEMGKGHAIQWTNANGLTARIRSDIAGPNLQIKQVFSDGGLTFYDNDGSVMLGVDRQKRARFGVFTATPSAVSGYITIKDSAGVDRKLAVLQ